MHRLIHHVASKHDRTWTEQDAFEQGGNAMLFDADGVKVEAARSFWLEKMEAERKNKTPALPNRERSRSERRGPPSGRVAPAPVPFEQPS